MKIREAIMLFEMMAGGAGSGCNPEVGVCGPHPKVFDPGSGKGQYAHFGKGSSKKIMGVWVKGTAVADLYTELMTGDWKKVSDLQKLLDEKGHTAKLDYRLYILGAAGKKLGLWDLEYRNGKSEARMVTKKDDAGQTKATQVTGDMAHAAQVAAQQLLKSGGDVFSSKVMQEFLKQADVEKGYEKFRSNMSEWVHSATRTGAMYMKAVAAEYYGSKWSDEYKHGSISPGKNFENVDGELKKTMMAVKNLASEYAKMDGTQYVYRGFSPGYGELKGMLAAAKAGKAIAIPMNSLTSWSTAVNNATDFEGGVVLRQQVQPENVWVASHAMNHLFGTFKEKEWIMGSKERLMYFKPEDIYISGGYGESHRPAWCKSC